MKKIFVIAFAGIFVLPKLCDYASMEAKNVNSTPKEINVTFESPVSSNATLRLASSTGNMPASDYGVESGTTTYSIPAANMPAGVYQVTLIEDGTVTGTKKFTK